ncbi:hypothetical protein D3C75_627310 [compost metagenome]
MQGIFSLRSRNIHSKIKVLLGLHAYVLGCRWGIRDFHTGFASLLEYIENLSSKVIVLSQLLQTRLQLHLEHQLN